MIKYISEAIALLMLAIVATDSQHGGQHQDIHGFTEDDYSIYGCAIAHAAHQLGNAFVVTGLKTKPNWDFYHADVSKRVPAEYQKALKALLAVDTLEVDWMSLAALGVEVVHPDSLKTAILRTIENKANWSQKYATLGPIGYDARNDKAIVYLSWSCGNLCGHGGFLLLERRAGIWEVVKWVGLWVS